MKEVLFILLAFQGEVNPRYLQKELEQFYHVKCKVVVDNEISAYTIDQQTHRYSAYKILDYLQVKYPNQTSIAVTSKGIAMNKENLKNGPCNWGIAGLSYQDRGVGVLSMQKLKTKTLAIKVMLHEFGHGQGLSHCASKYPCFMKDAKGKLSTISRQPKALCKICHHKLETKQAKDPYQKTQALIKELVDYFS